MNNNVVRESKLKLYSRFITYSFPKGFLSMLIKEEIELLMEEFYSNKINESKFDRLYKVTTNEVSSWRDICTSCLLSNKPKNNRLAWTQKKVEPNASSWHIYS